VHPYDDGNPRHNLSAAGIYTFATLSELVAGVQCSWLGRPEYGNIPAAQCSDWPQTQMYASEQGWPYDNVTMTKALQVRMRRRRGLEAGSGCHTLRTAHGETPPRPFLLPLAAPLCQARNICYAHGLSLAQGVWAVSHNFAQGDGPSSQGDAGDFSLLDYYPVIAANLSNGPGHPTYDAYMATAPGAWGVSSSNYCCTQWATGCPP
jgi:hypothetical protein